MRIAGEHRRQRVEESLERLLDRQREQRDAEPPALLGGKIFQSYDLRVVIPGWDYLETPWGTWTLFGEMHLVSSTVFDVGVYLIVIGVVLDLTRTLGAGIDIQSEQDQAPVPQPESTRAFPALTPEDEQVIRYTTGGGRGHHT